MRQQRQEQASSKTVEVDANVPQWLCIIIHINKQPAGLTVTLTDGAEYRVQLPLIEADLRRVLEIFRNSYLQTGWSVTVFPDWPEPQNSIVPAPTTIN